MESYVSKYDVTAKDHARGRNLKIAAAAAPLTLTAVPAIIFLALTLIFGVTPPAALTLFVAGAIVTAIGFLIGVGAAIYFGVRYSRWHAETRERIAADGIRAEEIDWFRRELKPNEKRALREISRSDILLADAYRETLASRLTATRIVRSSSKELSMNQRRIAKLKGLTIEKAKEFRKQIDLDKGKIKTINQEAKLMLSEAEARLQMIEAAASRGGTLADSELALKRLSNRAETLPLALEEARLRDEIHRELEENEL